MSIEVGEQAIPREAYQQATDVLAALSVWNYCAQVEPDQTIKALSNYLLCLRLSYEQDPSSEQLQLDFANGLVCQGISMYNAVRLSRDMTTPHNLRNIFSLKHIKKDEPNYGLRVKKHMRYLEEPKFIKAAQRLGGV
jgi:hypothetical protein